ncbi:hypothetical protein DLE01_31420, partial [Streptomyces sp. FT05W]
IKGLGTTAIWLAPIFKNRPVQGTGDNASAGYHGCWITDFTQVRTPPGNPLRATSAPHVLREPCHGLSALLGLRVVPQEQCLGHREAFELLGGDALVHGVDLRLGLAQPDEQDLRLRVQGGQGVAQGD